MTPERWQKVESLFHSAIKCEPGKRAAFLEEACASDESLRKEVESLLTFHHQSEGFIEAGAGPVAADMIVGTPGKLEPGKQLGHYKILSLLGVGGMGEVYLALDTKLGRRIALKLLPEQFTLDAQRTRRFEREARSASALNHPNIVTVYEIGQVENLQYIATEYIDGETLRQRLPQINSLRDVVDIACQVASALAAAHEAGIIHRDVKPENIMLRRDGFVKVLDFGLAKLAKTSIDISGEDAPTKPIVRTDPGTVMGTVQYMSPEQARSTAVDSRTDIWSLGVVVYEMLTGRVPFEGETASHVIVSILEKEPLPLSNHLVVPLELERIVAKTLNKDKEERYHSAQDLALDLSNLKQDLDVEARLRRVAQAKPTERGTGPTTDRSVVAAQTADESKRTIAAERLPATSSLEYVVTKIRSHRLTAAIACVAIISVVVGISYGLYRLRGRSKVATPFDRIKVTRLTTSGKAKDAAISPDSKYLVYVEEDNGQQSLWIKQIATGSVVSIVSPSEVEYFGLTFSNDSNYLYYIMVEFDKPFGVLYQVPSLGGSPRKLLEHIDSTVTFSPNGDRFAFVRTFDAVENPSTSLIIANADGTGERIVSTRSRPNTFVAEGIVRISWSPDGNVIVCPAFEAQGGVLIAVSVEDGSQTPLGSQGWWAVAQVAWLPDGSGLVALAFERSDDSFQIWHVSYPDGKAIRLTDDLNRYSGLSPIVASNNFVAVSGGRFSSVWISPTSDLGNGKQISSGNNEGIGGLLWTPDGKILFTSTKSGQRNLWLMERDGSNRRQLTHDTGLDPALSRNGKVLVFLSINKAGTFDLWRMDMQGGNASKIFDEGVWGHMDISSDSRSVLLSSEDPVGLLKLPIEGGKPSLVSAGILINPVVSPDGQRIACFYWDQQANPNHGVMIFPFEGGQPVRRFNINSHEFPTLRWSRDGNALLYTDTFRSTIWSQPVDGSQPTPIARVDGDQIFNFDYSPDGKWIVMARGRIASDVLLVTPEQ